MPAQIPLPVRGLHHWAYRCRDAEETRRFYEDVLGLPLAHVLRGDHVPTSGEDVDFVHLFFRLGDGSCIAFFDLGDDKPAEHSPNTPPWVNHLALRLDSVAAVEEMKRHLEAHGVEVFGVIDHGFVKSIYFFDPNGVRMEFTTDTEGDAEREGHARKAHGLLEAWTREKQQMRERRKA